MILVATDPLSYNERLGIAGYKLVKQPLIIMLTGEDVVS